MKIDDKSRTILHALQQNARTTVADLARLVDLAETTVRERVNHLEREGIITGYHAQIDSTKLGYGARGFVRADCPEATTRDICAKLTQMPEVRSVHVLTGDRRIQIELIATDISALDRAIEQRLGGLGLSQMDVNIVLGAYELRRPILTTSPMRQPLAPIAAGGGHGSTGAHGGLGGNGVFSGNAYPLRAMLR